MKFINARKSTKPLILHFNGGNKKKITDKLLNLIIYPAKIKKPQDLSIITFATYDIIDKSPLIKQLKENNINFFNICDYYSIEKWNNIKKIELLYNFLKDNFYIKTKYLIVLDSLDILLSEDFENIIDLFKISNKKILYGSTINRWPDVIIEDENDLVNLGSHKYLNAGTVIAETKYFIDFISLCKKNINYNENLWESEQYEIRKNYINYDKNIIGYDHECNISQTLSGVFLIETNDKIIIV